MKSSILVLKFFFIGIFSLVCTKAHAQSLVPIGVGDITIFIPVDGIPRVQNDSFTVNEIGGFCDGQVNGTTLAQSHDAYPFCNNELDVLANDSDDNTSIENLILAITVQPQHGVASVVDGKIHFIANNLFYQVGNGSDILEYSVTDEKGNVSVGQVDLIANLAPVVPRENEVLQRLFPGFEAVIQPRFNAADPVRNNCNGQVVSGFVGECWYSIRPNYTLMQDPEDDAVVELYSGVNQLPFDNNYFPFFQAGLVLASTPGDPLSVEYQPSPCVFGGDGCVVPFGALRFRVRDSRGAISRFSVIRVDDEGLPPIVVDDEVTITSGETIDIPVLDNDVDPQLANLFISVRTRLEPQVGTATVIDREFIRYESPTNGFTGTVTFEYELANSNGLASDVLGLVTVIVGGGNQPPSIPNNPIVVSVFPGQSQLINVIGNVTDADGDTVTLVGVSSISSSIGSVSIENGSVRFDANANAPAGSSILTYTVTDGNGGDVTGNIAIEIIEAAGSVFFNESSVLIGQPITISWNFSNSTGCSLNGQNVASVGNQEVRLYSIGVQTMDVVCNNVSSSANVEVLRLSPPVNVNAQVEPAQ
jgi:hypothetical protein